MRHRHPLPRVWLMTDERMGERLWDALWALPRGAGVVFRHHATPVAERRRMFAKVVRIGRSRGLVVLQAGRARLGHGGEGRHGSGHVVSAPVHDMHELRQVLVRAPKVIFVSPMFATRSHPGACGLRRCRAAALVRTARLPAIALGGMDARRFRQVRELGFNGWAAIDAWLPYQKRKAVPI